MIDLSLLPAPDVVEALDFETVFSEIKTVAIGVDSTLEPALQYESEPITKVLQVLAYRELHLRQRINDAARAVMLAYAQGADLDNIGARYGVARLLIQPANPDALPPIEAVYEKDPAFLRRILLSLEAFTTAGSEASYIYHALSASGDVLDASAVSPTPGVVSVYVLSRLGDGTASDELLTTVTTALSARKVRPLTDQVNVFSASIINFTIAGTLVISHGPDPDTVLQAANDGAQAYAASTHGMGVGISLSGVYRGLHQPGVLRVDLEQPAANIVVSKGQATFCSAINLAVEVDNG